MASIIDRGSGYGKTVSRYTGFYVGRVGYTGYRGTAALPPFSFEEDPNTGVYSASADSLNISAGGTNVFGMTLVASDTSIPPTTAPRVYVANITPAATTALSVDQQTFTVTGLATTDSILSVNPPAQTGDTWFIGYAYVSAANTLAIGFGSLAGTPTPTQGDYRVVAIRSAS